MRMAVVADGVAQCISFASRCMLDRCRTTEARQADEWVRWLEQMGMGALNDGPGLLRYIDGMVRMAELGTVLAAT